MSGSYGGPKACGVSLIGPQDEHGLRQWYAVQIRYRFEKKVVAELERKSCEVYLPLLAQHHTWSDREKVVSIPLFPGYAFVHIDQSRNTRQIVLQTAGLIGFVSFGGLYIPVPHKQIEDLRLLLRNTDAFSLHPFIHTGQRLRIRGGCLDGLEGLLLQHQKGKLLISIESIQRSVAIEIQGYDLELA